jgi:hypothetical protein
MIPLHTTTIAVLRRAAPDDAYEDDPEQSYAAVARGIRAHLDAASGSQVTAGGARVDNLVRFMCDPTDLADTDVIEDERTGLRWKVSVVFARPPAMGTLDHMAGLAQRYSGVTG